MGYMDGVRVRVVRKRDLEEHDRFPLVFRLDGQWPRISSDIWDGICLDCWALVSRRHGFIRTFILSQVPLGERTFKIAQGMDCYCGTESTAPVGNHNNRVGRSTEHGLTTRVTTAEPRRVTVL